MLNQIRQIKGRAVAAWGGALGIVGMGTAFAAPQTTAPLVAEKTPPPNIVFLLADDMGFADVGFNGGKEIKTPNIDRLAASGAVLKHFYAQPVCSPTRAALLTGRYPMRTGLQVSVVRPWAKYGLPLEERTLPQALKEAGYETAIAGKWHLGHFKPEYLPTKRGFDHQYGHFNGAIDYFTHERDGGLDWHRDDKALREEGYSTTLLAQEAVKNIQQRDKKKPLFLYVPFTAVHGPFQVPPRYKKAYPELKGQRLNYAGMMAALDEAVGKIVGEIETQGMRNNTLIVFASDNGGPSPRVVTDNGIFRAGKGTVYEGGVHVAACASLPGKIPAKSQVDQPMHMVDWYSTILKLGGASPVQKLPVDGRDTWQSLTTNRVIPETVILLNTTPTGGGIRVGDWKLVVGGVGSRVLEDEERTPDVRAGDKLRDVELYDLAADPSETKNVAAENPAKVKELQARYEAFAKQAVPPKSVPKPAGFTVPKIWGEN